MLVHHMTPFLFDCFVKFGQLARVFGQMVHRPPPPRQKIARTPMHFFEHVLNRTEEILNQTSNTSNEQHSEVLTHVHFLERTVKLTGQLARIVTGETDLKTFEKNGGPGRPSVNILPEVLEELRGLGFTWQKIASIFGVSRWTIMRRVRLFELEHLSLVMLLNR